MFLTLESFDFAFYCIICYKIIKIGSSSNNIDYHFIHFHYQYLTNAFLCNAFIFLLDFH